MDVYFDGICGCPKKKVDIINDLFIYNEAERPALFIGGGSKHDYLSAEFCGIDFIFMFQYTGQLDYKLLYVDKNIKIINNLLDLLSSKN